MLLSAKRLAPTCERVIEREHRDITMDVTAPHAGAVLVSLANRMPAVLEAVDNNPAYFPKLVSAFETVRHVRRVPELFPLIAMHPLLRQLSKAHQSSHWMAVLSSIVYHCDIDSKYADLGEAQRHDERLKDRLRRKGATVAARKANSKHKGYDTLVAVAVYKRLRALATEGAGRAVFSMPGTQASSSSLYPVVPFEVTPCAAGRSKELPHCWL